MFSLKYTRLVHILKYVCYRVVALFRLNHTYLENVPFETPSQQWLVVMAIYVIMRYRHQQQQQQQQQKQQLMHHWVRKICSWFRKKKKIRLQMHVVGQLDIG